MDTNWQNLIVHDGDKVRATGRFVSQGVEPAIFCGQVGSALAGDPTACPPHLSVVVHGLDPDRLIYGGTVAGHQYGNATVTGTWAKGEIHVEQQTEPDKEIPSGNLIAPCLPPAGGWRMEPLPSLNQLKEHLRENSTKFGPLWVGTDSAVQSNGPTPSSHVEIAVVPVFGADPESARGELSKLFSGNLCLIRAQRSLAQLDSAQAALRELMADKVNTITLIGSGARATRIEVRFLIATEALYRKLARVGIELIEPHPSIVPHH